MSGILRQVSPPKKAGVGGLVCYTSLVDLCLEDEGLLVVDVNLGGK